MMVEKNNDTFVTPNYVLNGVSSRRWIKPILNNTLTITGGNDLSCVADYCMTGSCATNYCGVSGCPTVTRAFYNVSEDGDVYLVTANGIIYYLANNTKTMKQIYPVNAFENLTKNAPGIDETGVIDVESGMGAAQFTVNPSDMTFNIVVVPSFSRVIPWRPGTTKCNVTVGENYLSRSFVIQKRSQMSFPYSNGYFCVQTDYNRCVVFYKGELIYDGEYNGMGLPLSFSYGLEKCTYGGNVGCCPHVSQSAINWDYRVLPKWRKNKEGNFVYESPVDRFFVGRKIFDGGKVIHSNMFYWDSGEFLPLEREVEDSSGNKKVIGYYADDSYQKLVKEVSEDYYKTVRDENGMPVYEDPDLQTIIKKEKKTRTVLEEVDFADEYPNHRRFDIYTFDTSSSERVSRVPIACCFVPLNDGVDNGIAFLRGTVGDIGLQKFIEEFNKLKEVLQQAKDIDVYSFIDLFKLPENNSGFTLIKLVDKMKNAFTAAGFTTKILAKLLSDIQNLVKANGGISELNNLYNNIKGIIELQNTQIDGDIQNYQTFLANIFNTNREGGTRIWWSAEIGTGKKENSGYDEEDMKVFCNLRPEEKIAVPKFGCESEMMYRCWEQLELEDCSDEEHGMSPNYLKWYTGIGYTENEGNTTLQEPVNYDSLEQAIKENKYYDSVADNFTQEEINEYTNTLTHHTGNTTSARQTLWLSRWRNELCVYCEEDNTGGSTSTEGMFQEQACPCSDTSLASNPYTTNNNCKWHYEYNNPGVCGKCNYPVSFKTEDGNDGRVLEEPCWLHVQDIPVFDEHNKVIDYKHCVSYRLNDDGEFEQYDGHFTHYCNVAVAKVALDYLGGRIESIPYAGSENSNERVDSDWGFIRIGANDCRVKKDYTVIGKVEDWNDLPGISIDVVRKDGKPIEEGITLTFDDILRDLKLEYKTNPITANAVILRAPGSIEGDKETGCVPGFANGEGETTYVMADTNVEQYQKVRFYRVSRNTGLPDTLDIPSKSELNKKNATLTDCCSYDYYIVTNRYTSKTTPTKVETVKETITNVQSTNKLVCYSVSNKNTEVSYNKSEDEKLNLVTTKYTLVLGNMGDCVTEEEATSEHPANCFKLYKVGYKNNIDYESTPVQTKEYDLQELQNISEWYKLGAKGLEVDQAFTYELSLPSKVTINTVHKIDTQEKKQIETEETQTEAGTGVTQIHKPVISLSEVDLSGYESTGEEFRPLVIYNVEKDFEKEFADDWGGNNGYINGSITSEEQVVYNGDARIEGTVGGSLCCTGIVKITHKYKIKETDTLNDDSISTAGSDKYSEHEDTYTITRYLYKDNQYTKSDENNDKKETKHFYVLEESVVRTLKSKRVLSVELVSQDGTLLEWIRNKCDNLNFDDDTQNNTYMKFLPGVAMTKNGLDNLCFNLSKAKSGTSEEELPVDSVDVRKEFLRFFPAFMTRPDYVGSINDGVRSGDYNWQSENVEEKCAEYTGVPSTSDTLNCNKLRVTAPINVTECYYNVESDHQPVNERSKSGAYNFKGFTNNWLIARDKLEYENKRVLEEAIQTKTEEKRVEKIYKIILAKDNVSKGYYATIEEALTKPLSVLESRYDEEYLTPLKTRARGNNTGLTQEELATCTVTLDELGDVLSAEKQQFINEKFTKPNKIVWYAKWEYTYTVEVDEDGMPEDVITNDTDEEDTNQEESIGVSTTPETETNINKKVITHKEMFYVPIPCPAGECYPYMVGSPIVTNDTRDTKGNIIALKEVDLVMDYKTDGKGNVTEILERHPIKKDDVGKWFCFGTFTDYNSALKNYGGVEKVIKGGTEIEGDVDASVISGTDANPYGESAGIKWVQAVNNWGDPHGIAIRGGTQMGDVYYIRKEVEVHKDPYSNSMSTGTYSTADLKPIITAIRYRKGREEYITKWGKPEVEGTTEELEPTYIEDLDVNNDKYVYWNGCEWVEGTTYFSDIDGEEVIFYKNKGSLNIAVENIGDKCLDEEIAEDENYKCGEWRSSSTAYDSSGSIAQATNYGRTIQGTNANELHCNDYSKAIFKGKVRNKIACGDILAVNLNTDKTFHKAIFLKEKPVWDRPAYGGEDYTGQKEIVRCLGMSYMAVTYNVGYNKQCFRLWYRDYDSDTEDNSKYVTFMKEYSYYVDGEMEGVDSDSGDVPDIGSIKDPKLNPYLFRKYRGQETKINKTYLNVLSRNKRYLYVFYKGVLKRKYDYHTYDEFSHLTEDYNHTKFTHTWEDLLYGDIHIGDEDNYVLYHPCTGKYMNAVCGPKFNVVAVGRATKTFENRKQTDTDWFSSLAFGGDFGKYDIYVDGRYKRTAFGYVSLDGAFVEINVYDHFDGADTNGHIYHNGFLATEVISMNDTQTFTLCGVYNEWFNSSKYRYEAGFTTSTFFSIVHKNAYYDSEYECYVIGDVGSNVPKSDAELLEYNDKSIEAQYYHIMYNTATQDVKITPVDFPKEVCNTIDKIGTTKTRPIVELDISQYESIIPGYKEGELIGVEYDNEVDYTSTYKTDYVDIGTEKCGIHFIHFWHNVSGIWQSLGKTLSNEKYWKTISSSAFVDQQTDRGAKQNVDAKVLLNGLGRVNTCNGTVGAPSGEVFGRQVVLYAFYPNEETFYWSVLPGATPPCETQLVEEAHMSYDEVATLMSVFGSENTIVLGDDENLGTVFRERGWIQNASIGILPYQRVEFDKVSGCFKTTTKDLTESGMEIVANNYESAKNKVLSYMSDPFNITGFHHSDYISYTGCEYYILSTHRDTPPKLELSLEEFFALYHYKSYMSLMYGGYVFTFLAALVKDNFHIYEGNSQNYGHFAPVGEATVSCTVMVNDRTYTCSVSKYTFSIELLAETYKIHKGLNPVGSYKIKGIDNKWDNADYFGTNAPAGCEGNNNTPTNHIPAYKCGTSVYLADVGIAQKWQSSRVYCCCNTSEYQNPCPNEGHLCDRLVTRDVGDGAIYTPGGDTNLFFISIDGVRELNEQNVDYYYWGWVSKEVVLSVLCPINYARCGLYQSIMIGRKLVPQTTYDSSGKVIPCSCNNQSLEWGDTTHNENFAQEIHIGSLHRGCKYIGYDWYNISFNGEVLDFDEVYGTDTGNPVSPFQVVVKTYNKTYIGYTSTAVTEDGNRKTATVVWVDSDGNEHTEPCEDGVECTKKCYVKYEQSNGTNGYDKVPDDYECECVGDVTQSEPVESKDTHTEFTVSCFATCCSNRRSYFDTITNNYVILRNGRIFYKTKCIADIRDCPGFESESGSTFEEKIYEAASKIQTTCCGDGILLTYKGYQCLFIEGKPVYPFLPNNSNGKPVWINGKGYMLLCCGYDYYWLQCGSFKDRLCYTTNIIPIDNNFGSMEDMYYTRLISKTQRSYDNPNNDIPDYVYTDSFKSISDPNLSKKIADWTEKYIHLLKDGETAFAAFLKPNIPLRKLEDGNEVEIIYRVNTETGEIIEKDDVKNVDLSYEDKEYEGGEVKKTINHYRFIECPVQWSLCVNHNVKFKDDYDYIKYEHASTGNNLSDLLDCLKMEKARYVPWKHIYSMSGRECYSYYRTNLISTDPRITELYCYRYRNVNVREEDDLDECAYSNTYKKDDVYRYRSIYHAIGAYAIFGDNPFYDAWADEHVKDFVWSERTPSTIDSAGSSKYFEYHYTETETIQNVLGVKQIGYEHNAENRVLCDVDDYYIKRGELNATNLIPCDNENPMVYDSAGSTNYSSVINKPTFSVYSEMEQAPSTTIDTSSKPVFITGSLYDTGNNTQRFCNMKGITREAQKNICMIVWSRAVCQTSYMNDDGNNGGTTDNMPTYFKRSWSDWHKNDSPFDELWDGSSCSDEDGIDRDNELNECVNAPYNKSREYWIRRLRSDVVYINDYNAAGRWDKVSGDDPVDDWQGVSRGEFNAEEGGYGGYWTSAPDFHAITDSYNDNLNPCEKSRLAVSGNNTLYVFDSNSRTDYDLFNGKRRTYPEMDKETP